MHSLARFSMTNAATDPRLLVDAIHFLLRTANGAADPYHSITGVNAMRTVLGVCVPALVHHRPSSAVLRKVGRTSLVHR